MAATITELSVEDFPVVVRSGTYKRRARVYFRGPAGSCGSTIALATYVPGVADVEGLVYESAANAAAGTASTWSTTTVTIANDLGTSIFEGCYAITFT